MTQLTNEKYIKLRDLILASEGSENKIWWCPYDRIDTTSKYIDDGKHRGCGNPVEYREPITLERVLRALGRRYPVKDVKVFGNGFISVYPLEGWVKWKLCLPAHEQEEETLEALIDILTPTKNE